MSRSSSPWCGRRDRAGCGSGSPSRRIVQPSERPSGKAKDSQPQFGVAEVADESSAYASNRLPAVQRTMRGGRGRLHGPDGKGYVGRGQFRRTAGARALGHRPSLPTDLPPDHHARRARRRVPGPLGPDLHQGRGLRHAAADLRARQPAAPAAPRGGGRPAALTSPAERGARREQVFGSMEPRNSIAAEVHVNPSPVNAQADRSAQPYGGA